jgi:hypothetical protein
LSTRFRFRESASQAIFGPLLTFKVISDNVEPLEHVVADDEEQLDFAEVGIFSYLLSAFGADWTSMTPRVVEGLLKLK